MEGSSMASRTPPGLNGCAISGLDLLERSDTFPVPISCSSKELRQFDEPWAASVSRRMVRRGIPISGGKAAGMGTNYDAGRRSMTNVPFAVGPASIV